MVNLENEKKEEVIVSENETLEKSEEKKEENQTIDNVDNELSLEESTENEEQPEEDELPPMEVVAEVETTYDYRTLKYCNMYILKVKRKSAIIYSVMAAVCIAIAVICFFTMEDSSKWVSIIIAILGLWTFKNIFTEESKIDKSLQNFFRTNAPFKQSFAFDRERIRVTAMIDGEVKQADYPWPYIQEIHMIPEFFILFLNGGTPIIIDRDESKLLQGTKEDLEQIIREQSALKPFKSYDKPLVKKLVDITYYVSLDQEEKLEKEDLEKIESAEENEANDIDNAVAEVDKTVEINKDDNK